MLEGKFTLTHVTRVGLPQNSMAKPRNNLPTIECLPDEVGELLLGHILSELLAETIEPNQYLLYMHHMHVYHFLHTHHTHTHTHTHMTVS